MRSDSAGALLRCLVASGVGIYSWYMSRPCDPCHSLPFRGTTRPSCGRLCVDCRSSGDLDVQGAHSADSRHPAGNRRSAFKENRRGAIAVALALLALPVILLSFLPVEIALLYRSRAVVEAAADISVATSRQHFARYYSPNDELAFTAAAEAGSFGEDVFRANTSRMLPGLSSDSQVTAPKINASPSCFLFTAGHTPDVTALFVLLGLTLKVPDLSTSAFTDGRRGSDCSP